MINKVKNTLKDKLKTLYPNYNIYLEEQESEIVKPALSIKVEEKTASSQRDLIRQNVKLDIICNIDEINKYGLYWDISDKFDQELECLEIEDTLIKTGEKISEITEGQLHYRFLISFNTLKIKESVKNINQVQSNTGLKQH